MLSESVVKKSRCMIVHFRLLRSDGSEEDGTEHRGGKGEGVVYYFARSLGRDSKLGERLIRERVPHNKKPNLAMPRWFVSSGISDHDLILIKNGVSSGIELEAGFIQIRLRCFQPVIEMNK